MPNSETTLTDLDYSLQANNWLKQFLSARHISEPNGLLLYTYQITKEEYEDLKQLLKDYSSTFGLKDFLKNKTIGRLFIAFASEWWKREYAGGAWSWEPIYQSFTNEEPSGLFQLQKKAIIEALTYWKYNIIQGTGKCYLGAIVANGGIPAYFIQDQTKNSTIIQVLRTSLQYANTHFHDRSDLFEKISTLAASKIPIPLRKNEIYNLFTDIITTISELKQNYNLEKEEEPIRTLNINCPCWKQKFPLLLEDASIEKMLMGFVNEAAHLRKETVFGKIPYAERILEENSDGVLEFKFRMVFPDFVQDTYFSKYYNILNSKTLPQQFFINVTNEKNEVLARVSAILGSSDQFKIRVVNEKFPITNELISHLASPDNNLHGKEIQLCDSINLDSPLIFIKQEDGTFILKGNGSTSVHEEECYIAISQEETPEHLETLNKKFTIDDKTFSLYKCSSDHEIKGFQIKVAQPIATKQYFFEGKTLEYISRPYRVFKGLPELYYVDNDSEKQPIVRKNIVIKEHGTDTLIKDYVNYSGPVDYCYYATKGELLYKKTIVLLPEDSNISFSKGENYQSGEICFKHFNCCSIDIASEQNCKIQDISTDTIKIFSQDSKPPKEIQLLLSWTLSKRPLIIHLPFPNEGVKIYDEKDQYINEQRISLGHLAGKRIQITNLQNNGSVYQLDLKLKRENNCSLYGSLDCSKTIYTNSQQSELRLQDFEDDIQNLMSYSTFQTAFIEMTISNHNNVLAKLYIARYDIALVPEDLALQLSIEDYQRYKGMDWNNFNLKMVNLLDENMDVRTLTPIIDSNNCHFVINENLKNSLYLVFSPLQSELTIKPQLFYNSLPDNPLVNCLIVPEEWYQEKEKLQRILCNDFDSPLWSSIDVLSNLFLENKVPLMAIPLWKMIAQGDELLSCFLLRNSIDLARKMKTELSILPETIPYNVWKEKLTLYKNYIEEKFHDYGRDLINSIFQKKFEDLCELFPSYEFLIATCFLDLCMISMNIAIDKLKDGNLSVNELTKRIYAFIDDENHPIGAVQKLQIQTPPDDQNGWITLPFREMYEKALRSSKYSEIMKICGQYLFKIDHYAPYVENVINFPMICAVYAYSNKDIEWLQPKYRLAIKTFLNFNENYYIKAYKIASEIIYNCMEYSLG